MADSNDRPTNGDTNHNDAHADAPNDKDEEDFLRVMRSLNQPTEDDLGLGNIFARDLEVGEKAQDAVDYEDLSDDDLPEEEDATATAQQPAAAAAPVAAAAPEAGGEGVGMEDVDMNMNMAITDLDLAMGMGMDLDLPNLGFEIEGAPETAAAPQRLEPIQEQPREEEVDSLFGGDDEEVGAQEAAAEDALDDLFGEAEPELPTDQTAEQPADAEKQEVKREEEEQYPFAEGRQVPLRPAPTGGATPLDETRRRESAERRGKETQAEAQRDEEEDEDEEAVRKSREPTQEAPEEQQEEPDMDPATFKEWQLQQALFAMSSYGMEPPAPPENHEELLASLWPRFRKDELPRFLELLPPKRSYFIGKQPAKTPKKIVPTRLHLELAIDQERSFRSSVGSGVKRGFDGSTGGGGVVGAENVALVHVRPDGKTEERGEGRDDASGLVDLADDMDEELPGGVTMQDLQVLCADWDGAVAPPTPPETEEEEQEKEAPTTGDVEMRGVDDDWMLEENANKKRKTGKGTLDFVSFRHVDVPYYDDPMRATEKIARTINIDLNDPYLLLDEFPNEAALKAARKDHHRATSIAGQTTEPGAAGAEPSIAKKLLKRYNISNDEAYDMLKENHQNKVRSTLGNIAIEHSVPAIRLQWPYYKTKLARQEARSFHRPALSFFPNLPTAFKKPAFIKRKHQRGKDVKTLYDSTKALSLADNSHVLLVEYSEEHPIMLSNFGMGSRLVNYYRRRNMEDTSRPKAEIGETAVLLPQDKSPFSIFGHVDPGETTTALVTSMYRAPVWQHQTKPTDFLVIRNSTGVEGSHYYLRIIENLFVAGQQFPSVDVPGPHSRKVTTASKNRLKMIAYRKIRRNDNHRVSVADITEHFPDSNDMQNRQKMKEFLQFNKDYKEWGMKPGEPIPDEEMLKGYVKPEDVCLLESMQVGQQHLHDSGYDKDEDEADDDEGKEGESLEQQMAPWKTTRNFLMASSGKAMLQLHGDGDPTGRGEGFSFIKTSMKGGFRAVGESVEDKLDAARLKELGGHSYNVARQQKSYEDSIRRIWESQKKSLSSTVEESEDEMDIDEQENERERERGRREASEEVFRGSSMIGASRTERPTPSITLGRRGDDETGSVFSRFSTSSQSGKIMRITRKVRNAHREIETVTEIVRDPRVIKQYQKQRHEAELRNLQLNDIKPTGDPETDARRMRHIQEELQRLQRNKERRHAREKQRGIVPGSGGGSVSFLGEGGSPVAGGSVGPGKGGSTMRKCANCGQVGHIKTNKKLCPMLNGEWERKQKETQGQQDQGGQSQGQDGGVGLGIAFGGEQGQGNQGGQGGQSTENTGQGQGQGQDSPFSSYPML